MRVITLENPWFTIPINKIDYVSLIHEQGDWWAVMLGFSQISRRTSFDNEAEATDFYNYVVEELSFL